MANEVHHPPYWEELNRKLHWLETPPDWVLNARSEGVRARLSGVSCLANPYVGDGFWSAGEVAARHWIDGWASGCPKHDKD